MHHYVRRGITIALTVAGGSALGVTACADPLAPPLFRVEPPSSALTIAWIIDWTKGCTSPPCPPGMFCAAVCSAAYPVEQEDEEAPVAGGDAAVDDGTTGAVQ